MAAPGARHALSQLRRGDRLQPFEICLGVDDVRGYLEATGEDPARWSETVPPLALGAFALGGLMEQLGVPSGMLHSGQEFDFLRPIACGQSVTVETTVGSHTERRGTRLIALDLSLEAAGEVAVMGRTTIVITPEG